MPDEQPTPLIAENPEDEEERMPVIMVPERPDRYNRSTPTKIKEILSLPSLTEQINAFMKLRNCFGPESDSPTYPVLQQYMNNTLSLEAAIDQIAEPIEDLWLTGDHCEREPDENEDQHSAGVGNSAVSTLMDLWYGVMHMAKLTPWTDEAAQNKLVTLITTFSKRPAPIRTPEQEAIVQQKNPRYWTDDGGDMWHERPWYGLCAAEVRNDAPGCGSGLQYPEGIAWANLKGYQLRLALAGDLTVKWGQELDALHNLEHKHDPDYLDANMPAIAVSILLCGQQIYDREYVILPREPHTWYYKDPNALWVDKPRGSSSHSKAKWAFWKRRLAEIAADQRMSVEAAVYAGCCVEFMDRIEEGAARREAEREGI